MAEEIDMLTLLSVGGGEGEARIRCDCADEATAAAESLAPGDVGQIRCDLRFKKGEEDVKG
jgi:hypothetical protein